MLTCTACRQPSHELTRIKDGVWHCRNCRAPKGYACIKKVDSTPPSPQAVKFRGALLAVFKIGPRPDYSRN